MRQHVLLGFVFRFCLGSVHFLSGSGELVLCHNWPLFAAAVHLSSVQFIFRPVLLSFGTRLLLLWFLVLSSVCLFVLNAAVFSVSVVFESLTSS